ncbi:MAG: VWA domain-containing protein [Spirochaetes bacterium]|nr:VWA domain-containing protein [Spirochaetota bacterium]
MKSILLKIVFFTLMCSITTVLFAQNEGKDVIIVLDTSQSMIGKGGKNVMPVVKDSLKNVIDNFNVGDSLTFMTFDSDVKIYPTVSLTDDNAKDIVKKYVTMVEATGWWTFTDNMIQAVKEKAADIKTMNPERPLIVLIFTDALDDPPPADKSKKLDITEIGKLQSDYVYLIDLSQGDLSALQGKLQSDSTANVEVIDATSDTATALDSIGSKIDNAQNDYNKKNRPFYLNPFFIAALLTAILLCILIYMMRAARYKVAGMIKYRNLDKVRVEWEETDLSRFLRKRVVIGKSPTYDHYLRDYDDTKPVVFEAINFRGNVKVAVNETQGIQVDFKGDKKESFLRDGDTFTASNYEFVYLEQLKDK